MYLLKKRPKKGELVWDVLVVMVTAAICLQTNQVKCTWWFIGNYYSPHHTQKVGGVLYTGWRVKYGIVDRHIHTASSLITADVNRMPCITFNVHTVGYWWNEVLCIEVVVWCAWNLPLCYNCMYRLATSSRYCNISSTPCLCLIISSKYGNCVLKCQDKLLSIQN